MKNDQRIKMAKTYIKTEDLYYSYKDDDGVDVPVLRGVSLEIPEGQYVALIGRNGSGKSTFAKLLNMIISPDSGKILIGERDITAPDFSEDDMFEIRKEIGMVFQNPDNQLVATIVEEDVAFGPENLGIKSEEIRERVDSALAAVKMTEYAKHEPHRLSGGQKQRIAIAGIIAMLPKCIIFDESTAMLDPIGRRDVMEIMEDLNKNKGITIIHITHYMNEAAKADRIVVLNEGKVELDGTPREIFSSPDKLTSLGLDVPQGTELIYELSKLGYELPSGCTDAYECADAIFNAMKKARG